MNFVFGGREGGLSYQKGLWELKEAEYIMKPWIIPPPYFCKNSFICYDVIRCPKILNINEHYYKKLRVSFTMKSNGLLEKKQRYIY